MRKGIPTLKPSFTALRVAQVLDTRMAEAHTGEADVLREVEKSYPRTYRVQHRF